MIDRLKLLMVITDRQKADKIVSCIKQRGANYEHILLGKGTAPTDLLSVLGLGTSEKAVITATVKEDGVEPIYEVLRTNFHFDKPGQGIALTIPLSAVGGRVSQCILSGNWNVEEKK